MFRVDGGPDSPSFGRVIGSLGDVDGDGTREWIVGYPEPRDEAPGQVIVYSGADASPIHALAGAWPQDRFGYDVAAMPDLDGDGVEDFLVGAPTEPNRKHGKGNIHVFSGASGARLRVIEGDDVDSSWFGGEIELVHDFDADGWPDLGIVQNLSLRIVSGRSFEPILARHFGVHRIASMPDRDGDARPEVLAASSGFSGGRFRVLSIQDAPELREWHGESGDRFGESLWAGEDLDGDGVQELAIVARGADDRRMQILSPVDGRELLRLDVESEPADFAWLDDLDGDGRPELAASWTGSDPRVTIHSGASGATLHVVRPANEEIAALGDLDGDGRADLAVLDSGSVAIYSTASFQRLLDLPEVAPGSGFGESILALGDVDADGSPDVFVTDEGRQVAYAFSGRDGSLLHTIQAPEPYTAFGREAFAPVDMDRDGTLDVFVWSAGLDVLHVYSGDTLEPLTTLEVVENNFGESVANGGDIDGDSWDDVLVGSGVWNRVFALSSATHAVLWTLDLDWAAGETFAGPGDVDGDGYADIAIGSPHDNLGGLYAGAVRIFPGGCTAPEPVRFCEPDATARIGWQGSTSVSQNDFVLTVTESTPSQPGLFVMSDAKSDQPFGEGRRCVGDPLYRFPIQHADASGAATRHVDFGAPPALGRIVPSAGWFFQWWFRAPATPSGFDASDGLAGTFCR